MWQEYVFVGKYRHERIEELKLPPNAKIQETDPLFSLRFGRDILNKMLNTNRRKFRVSIILLIFFVNGSLLYFEDSTNNVAFFIDKFDFEPR